MRYKKIEIMEPNNFEQHSREKFEERKMQPSDGAWEKLEQMLNEAQPEKKKSSFPWFAIAASFVGIAIIATVYFSQNNNDENRFVEQDSTSEILKTETPDINNTIESEVQVAENMMTDSQVLKKESFSENELKKSKINNTQEEGLANSSNETSKSNDNLIKTPVSKNNIMPLNKKSLISIKKQKAEAIAVVTTKEQKDQLLKISEAKTLNKTTIEKSKVDSQFDAVIAQVKELKNTKAEVTEADIDALLLKAQHQLNINRILSNKKVDAMALLSDAEMELNESFRDKIFYALEEGFDYVKSTIVTRDN